MTELIPSATMFDSKAQQPYTTTYDVHQEAISLPGIDLSSFSGPLAPRDEATFLKYNRLESEGQLTGGLGLGAGLKPGATITSSYLMASSPVEASRMLTRRGSRMNRSSTIKHLAQREANKSGQIIEVIVEDPKEQVDMDISTLDASASTLDFAAQGIKRTEPLKKIYYPEANWKPVAMRWPYLSALIVVSVTLGVYQEYLYQRSAREGGLFKFHNPKEINTWDYFSFKYLPSIIAVAYGILWQLADFEVKRLEAYYQLSKPHGALAAESISVDYVTLFDIFRPFVALRYKHWAVAVSAVASLFAVSLVPTLQSASVGLSPERAERLANPTALKSVEIDAVWSRVLTLTLFVISAFGIVLLVLLSRRRSGLIADVKGIAGIAAMATQSHVLMDFKDLDTVPPKDIHNKLKNHRYTLRNSSLAPDTSTPLSATEKDKYDAYHLSSNPHPLMMRLAAGIPLIISMVLFMLFVPALLFTPASIVSDKVPWLTTLLVVALKFSFQTMEHDVRMMEPFYVLSQRHAPPKILVLDYTGMAFGYMPLRALFNKHYLVAAVGFGSVLAEVLTVCVTSVAGVTGSSFLPSQTGYASGQETPVSFWVSFVLVLAIMVYMVVATGLVMALRRRPFLPRQPATIASVLGFVHQSKMLWDFVAGDREGRTVQQSNLEMVRRLEESGMTFGYGWCTGRDGEVHCAVDVEELQGNYRHARGGGQDRRKAIVRPGWENL